MRAYKVICDYVIEVEGDDDTVITEDVTVFQFAGTQADAKSARREYSKEYEVKLDEVKIEEIEIPTDKTGLLAFINDLINE